MISTQTRTLRLLRVGSAVATALVLVGIGAVTPSRASQWGAIRLPALRSASSDKTDAPVRPLYLKVHFGAAVKPGRLQAGSVIEGTLVDPVFSADREVFPAGSRVHMTVDGVESVRRSGSSSWPGSWPWIVHLFLPRHSRRPTFSKAEIEQTGANNADLQVSLISMAPTAGLRSYSRTTKRGASESSPPTAGKAETGAARDDAGHRGTTACFQAFGLDSDPGSEAAGFKVPEYATIDPGTEAKVLLLGAVTAGSAKRGDSIAARLLQPIKSGSMVLLPEGSVFEGHVVSAGRPKWLGRPGYLRLAFDHVELPNGTAVPVQASIAGAQLDSASRIRIDPEGDMRGGKQGTAWILINLGTTVGLSKVADDGTQLVIELIASTATDASTAGVARLVSTAVSGVFMLTRRGRDVVLPKFAELRIVLDEPVVLRRANETPASGVDGGKF